MPRSQFGPGFRFLPATEILSFEEIQRLVRLTTPLGVKKLRLTGGEPLLRRNLPELIRMISGDASVDVAMTTNGSLLGAHARSLHRAGLQRVTVSLDSLDESEFRKMADVDVPVQKVIEGIDAAQDAGLEVKVNAVIRRGVNDHGLLDLVRHFRGTPIALRLIEFMDVGNTNRWQMRDVLGAGEMRELIHREFPLERLPARYPGEVAQRYRYQDGSGELGIIASVTEPFCGDCTRSRLSAQGRLYTCLFTGQGLDLRSALRDGSSDSHIVALLRRTWTGRTDAYSEMRGAIPLRLSKDQKIEMSYIGG